MRSSQYPKTVLGTKRKFGLPAFLALRDSWYGSGLLLLAIGALNGYLVARAAYLGSSSIPKQMLLPIVLGGALLLAIDPTGVFFLVMITRGSVDKPFENIKFGNSGVGAFYNAAIVVLLAYFIFIKPRRFLTVTLPFWGPFLCVAALAVVRAPEPKVAIKTFFLICSCMAVFSIPLCMRKRQLNLEKCRNLLVTASVFPALYGVLDFARGGSDGGRIMSSFLHENIFAFFLALTLVLTFMSLRDPAIKTTPTKRFFLTGWCVVLLLFLGLTGTRSAWAGCIFVFLAYGLVMNRKFLIYLVIGLIILFLLPPVQDRLGDLFQKRQYESSLDQTNSFSWRLNMWRLGLGYLKSSDYLLGKGLDSFFYYSLTFNPLNYNPNFSHNAYVQTFFEMGIVGIIAVSWLFFNIFRLLLPYFLVNRYEAFAYLSISLMYLFFCFGDNLYYYLTFNWYFALVIGVGCASAMDIKDQRAAAKFAENVVFRGNDSQLAGQHQDFR